MPSMTWIGAGIAAFAAGAATFWLSFSRDFLGGFSGIGVVVVGLWELAGSGLEAMVIGGLAFVVVLGVGHCGELIRSRYLGLLLGLAVAPAAALSVVAPHALEAAVMTIVGLVVLFAAYLLWKTGAQNVDARPENVTRARWGSLILLLICGVASSFYATYRLM